MGALYHLKQKLVDFCNVIQENVSRTDTVPSSKVVYDLKADSDSQISDLNDSLTNRTHPTDTISLTSNGLTLRYRCIGSILFFDLIGEPTSASVVAEFTVPTAILGYYQRVIQWGDNAKLMDIWVDSSSNKLRARNYNTLGVRASGSFLTNL